MNYAEEADAYALAVAGELAGKPLDRALLNCLIEESADLGPLVDLGCGPGHITAYLASQGAGVVALDQCTTMVELARERHPHLDFHVGDVMALPWDERSLGGAVAFYSLIHVEPAQMVLALREIRRVLRPGGQLLAAFHIGHGQHEDFYFFELRQMQRWFAEAGFTMQYAMQRQAYPQDIKFPYERGYVCGCA